MSKRAGGVIPITVELRRGAGPPLHAQVYRGLREAILTGRLPPGARLPSTRILAADLGVSRTTALDAFEQLVTEGYLEGRVGSGTRVSKTLPEELLRARQSPRPKASTSPPQRLSARATALASLATAASPFEGPLVPFRVGSPAVSEFPIDTWTRILARRAGRASVRQLDYGETAGLPELRSAIAQYLRSARGVVCEPEQVLIVSGSQQALDLATRVTLDPGDTAWMEDPGYRGALGALVAAGADIVPVPVDSEGLQVDEGARLAPRPRLICVTPSHQFPLGVTMSANRRIRLLSFAQTAGAWIVEDDYDSEFRYVHRPLAALQGLDTDGRVLYIGTFSKVLFPSLRLGYLVVPKDLTNAFSKARHFSDGHPPALDQLALADFLTEGHFERHIRRMRILYRERQHALRDSLDRHLKGFLTVEPAEGGMHLVAWLNAQHDDQALARRAAQAGVDAIGLSAYAQKKPARGALILGYAAFTPAEIEAGVERLARTLKTLNTLSRS